ncbi:SDR family NAD(P)-dependent oxidoreductase [Parafrankia elaeagni]|uniref:SDR family NAD(P)-dependent oxidoreductase n=1 Tax=Parafrankia elaeagni TaxID=222534 RepID=UPI00037B24CF|nr:SDR family NAD(P)-dependent oxidoreductase [Parafrankia elaeagni]
MTGANRGLGARLVERLLDAGARRVYATARDPRSVTATVSTDPRVDVLALDVTDQSSVDAAAKTATDATILVNNAGVLGFGGALDGDLDLFQRDVATNYGTVMK